MTVRHYGLLAGHCKCLTRSECRSGTLLISPVGLILNEQEDALMADGNPVPPLTFWGIVLGIPLAIFSLGFVAGYLAAHSI